MRSPMSIGYPHGPSRNKLFGPGLVAADTWPFDRRKGFGMDELRGLTVVAVKHAVARVIHDRVPAATDFSGDFVAIGEYKRWSQRHQLVIPI